MLFQQHEVCRSIRRRIRRRFTASNFTLLDKRRQKAPDADLVCIYIYIYCACVYTCVYLSLSLYIYIYKYIHTLDSHMAPYGAVESSRVKFEAVKRRRMRRRIQRKPRVVEKTKYSPKQ